MIRNSNTITTLFLGIIVGLAVAGFAREARVAPVPPGAGASAQAGARDAAAAPRTFDYSRIPLYFEANRGQAPADVRFISRGQGYALFLTDTGPRLALHRYATASGPAGRGADRSTVIAMKLVGARRHVRIRAGRRRSGTVNYLLGKDPRHWHRGIPTYGRVVYSTVYPGIDLTFHGRQDRLEYDFEVSPGADPGAIRLSFGNARKMWVDGAGRLHLRTNGGEVIQQAPVAYQTVGGVRHAVASRYVLDGPHRVSFAVSGYDRHRALVIDPVLTFSSYLGGADNDRALAIARDPVDGSIVYITGRTASADFPATLGSLKTPPDAFVMSVDDATETLIYATYLGGSGRDEARAIVADAAGNAFVAGRTDSWDFPVTNGTSCPDTNGDLVCDNGGDAFVAKLSASGGVTFGTYFGGCYDDAANGIALDDNDSATANFYIAGYTSSASDTATSSTAATCVTGFPAQGAGGQPALQGSNNGRTDAFVARFDAQGGNSYALGYATFLGGTHADEALGIAVSGTGNAYITGDTSSSDFPLMNPIACPQCDSTHYHAFVSQINATGTALVYSTLLGGSKYDYGDAIALDSARNAYVTGWTRSPDFPVTAADAVQPAHGGDYDIFVSKLNPAGSALLYSTYLGTSDVEAGQGIVLDGDGNNIWITGYTMAPDLLVALLRDVRPDLYSVLDFLQDYQSVDGSSDTPEETPDTDEPHNDQPILNNYVLNNLSVDQLASALGQLDPSLSTDAQQTVLKAESRSVLIGKIFDVVNGDVAAALHPIQPSRSGIVDGFVVKLASKTNAGASAHDYTVSEATYLGGRQEDYATGITLDGAGNPYVVGYTQSGDFPVSGNALQSEYCPSSSPSDVETPVEEASETADEQDNACGEDGFVTKIVKGDVDLSVTMTSDAKGPVDPGTKVAFTMTVKNNSATLTANSVQLTDNVPIGLQLVSAAPANECTPSSYDPAQFNHTVTCYLGALKAGATATVNVTVKTTAETQSSTQDPGTTQPAGPPPQVNSASVKALATDDVSGNNTASVKTFVNLTFIPPENTPHPVLSQKFPTFRGIDPPGGGGALGLWSVAVLAGGAAARRTRPRQ